MKKIVLKIGGMTCSACSSGLEKYLNKQIGVKVANVNLVLSIATIEYENINKKNLERYIKEAGFESLGEFKGIDDIDTDKSDKTKLIYAGIFILFIMYISMGHMLKLPNIPFINHDYPIFLATVMFISTLVFLCYGYDILKSGVKNLIHKMPNMDTLVMFGVLFSFLYSLYGYINIILGVNEHLESLYFESTCMVIYFIKLGRFIEDISKDKTKDAIKKLVTITPQNAILKVDGKERCVSIDYIKKGDLLICKSGDKIAVDGIVENGKTYVDESFITGESIPVLKSIGSKLIAGSICYDGYIEYRAKRVGKESTISEIVKLVVEATNTKSKIQKLADKISGYFVPIILIISVLTFIVQMMCGLSIEKSLIHMVTVLVVACPCALGLAVPLVVVVSNGLCAKKGLFLRNSGVLEKAKNIDTIVFDKTGTLTFGKLNIFKFFNYSEYKNNNLLNIVSNLEANSSHPITTAFRINKKLEVNDFKTLNGIGVYGKINGKDYYLGNDKILSKLKIKDTNKKDYDYLVQNGCSIIYIIENNAVIGLIGVRDIIRADIKNIIHKFNKNNIEVIMLTGDNEVTAKIIADELTITKVIANVLPQEKAKHIKKLIDNGKKVIMVGDGINDAPALVSATIGISVNDGTDVAMDSADVILMNNDISNILDLITISKCSYNVIKQNLFWAFFYNICMIPIAMGLFSNIGINMTPIFGSIAMIFSSLTVVLNSLRFGRVKK
ncbi:MAG: cadmium-translocating P-type ATPase [Bacilli bacterium]|nr:cadmium-translocating P-type ATPase [Bacilli bacterium]